MQGGMLYWQAKPGGEGRAPVRVALLADIHSNLEALTAVLDDAREQGALDEVWCLGDIVGYGPDPDACVETILGMGHVMVAGNHDLASVGSLSLSLFNADAAAACRWTGAHLSQAHAELLAALPLQTERSPFTLVHGSSRAPLSEYVASPESAQACLDRIATPHCLVGHSHVPFVCREGRELLELPIERALPLVGQRIVANPGAVGQPRDGDSRASYAIYDEDGESLRFRRVAYDLASTQRKMRLAGLPEILALRLQFGQ